jgi:hypothetical protein
MPHNDFERAKLKAAKSISLGEPPEGGIGLMAGLSKSEGSAIIAIELDR